jgi:predicted RNase H-like nuclease (RuvC/YqgF family)
MTYHEHYEKRIKNLQDMVTERDKEIAELKDEFSQAGTYLDNALWEENWHAVQNVIDRAGELSK